MYVIAALNNDNNSGYTMFIDTDIPVWKMVLCTYVHTVFMCFTEL